LINFVTTRSHAYTVRHLVRQLGRGAARQWSYERLLRQPSLPSGAWVFTDHERLSDFEIHLAAKVAAALERGGALVLNHPAALLRRSSLLRRLEEAGINSFSAWPCESRPRPRRFPVFIRNEFDHRSAGIELIGNQAELDARLARMRAEGVSLAGKLVIEFAGQEVRPGIWRRFAAYRAGDQVICHHMAFDFHWLVKEVSDPARFLAHPMMEEFLASERRFVLENQYEDILRKAFDVAGVDYGRADFSLLDGRPQIFEINTNPTHASHRRLFRDIDARRREIQRHSEERLYAALRSLSRPASHRIRLDDPELRRQQSVLRLFTGLKRG
jgi:hypothetical protein